MSEKSDFATINGNFSDSGNNRNNYAAGRRTSADWKFFCFLHRSALLYYIKYKVKFENLLSCATTACITHGTLCRAAVVQK